MVGMCHGVATDRIAAIASQFNDGYPVLFTLAAGLNGTKAALDGFWETADSYIFVRQGGIGEIDDINSDSAYSDIGYSSFMHNETFNTFFTNDGLGNGGYSGVIYNKSAWDGSPGYPSQPMVLMQGWMIDSWPDYRFISNKSLSKNEQRYFGLQSPSGYKTTINFEYLENDYLTPEQVRQGYATPAPPYVVGNRDDEGYFSYKINASELDEAAFVDYYRNTLNSSAGAFSTVEYVGAINEYKETGSNNVINVNFFQGFIDFQNQSEPIDEAFKKIVDMRQWYFRNKLWTNSQPPDGTDSEIDIAAYSMEYGDDQSFVAKLVPYDAVAAVGLFHSGPKWTLATRPQPPHAAIRESWSVSPEYYSIYVPATYLQSNITSKLNGIEVDMVEVYNLVGTNLGLDELDDIIDTWSESPGRQAEEVLSPWIDLYPENTIPGFEVVSADTFLSSPTNFPPQPSYLKVVISADSTESINLSSIPGSVISDFGVWVTYDSNPPKGSQNISGSLGSDDIYGGQGDDMLTAFSGTDRLTGGPGIDMFSIFPCDDDCLNNSGSASMAIITDLEEGETIQLSGGNMQSAKVTFKDQKWPGVMVNESMPAAAYQSGGYTVILVDSRPVAQVWRTSPSELEMVGTSTIKKVMGGGETPSVTSDVDSKTRLLQQGHVAMSLWVYICLLVMV